MIHICLALKDTGYRLVTNGSLCFLQTKRFRVDIRQEMEKQLPLHFTLEKEQSQEEMGHAYAMADYIIKRGGTAIVDKIDVVPNGWGTPLEVFEHVYKHECHVSALVDKLVDVAAAEKDKATQDFLWGFVREQVEEEATAQGIVDKIKKAGDTGIFFVDSQLGQR